MKKNIKLNIKDYRDYFNEKHIKKPYYLFIEYGEKTFQFSNKELALRFLTKFKKESTELYVELGTYLKDSYQYFISLVDLFDYPTFKKNTDLLNIALDRYYRILNDVFVENIQIGRELNNLYFLILNQFQIIKKILQKNNRNKIILSDLNLKIKLLKRLKYQFDLLLSDSKGIKKVIKTDSNNYSNYLKIA